MSLSPIPLADAAMAGEQNDAAPRADELSLDASMARELWDQMEADVTLQTPFVPPNFGPTPPQVPMRHAFGPESYLAQPPTVVTPRTSQEDASHQVPFNGVSGEGMPFARTGENQSIRRDPPPYTDIPYTGANTFPHGNPQPQVEANPPAPSTSLENLATTFTSMLNQRSATSGIAADPIESTQVHPPTLNRFQLPQVDHRGVSVSQEIAEPRASRRRRDEPPSTFVDPTASPPKAYYKQQAEALAQQLAQSQAQIAGIEQSVQVAIQHNKEQTDAKFAQLTTQWQQNALANIKDEMDASEQRYREQVAIECKQRQDLVDKQLSDSDAQIATILQQAKERERAKYALKRRRPFASNILSLKR